ncbi:MAG: Ig-like domain-containing protein, partial [Eubacteriales bacterium]|nr:Ig-like domain-containing protein [Eubacteriales bacterium]
MSRRIGCNWSIIDGADYVEISSSDTTNVSNITVIGTNPDGYAIIKSVSNNWGTNYYKVIVEKGVEVTGISITPNDTTIYTGDNCTLTASIEPANATNKSLTWTSSDPAIARVDNTGKVTAVSQGEVTITATATDGSNQSATATITVKKKVNVNSVTITGAHDIYTDETLTLSATVSPENASIKDLTWSSSNNSVATVDSNGVVTPVSTGEVTITARSTDGSNKSATATITVKGKEEITLTYPGEPLTTDRFDCYYNGYNNNDTHNPTISKSGENVSAQLSYNYYHNKVGVTLTPQSVGGPTVVELIYYTGSYNNFTKHIVDYYVTVEKGVIKASDIDVAPSEVTIYLGDDPVAFTSEVTPTDADDKSVTWTSGNGSVATVDANGTVTAVDVGDTVIRATANDGSRVYGEAIVHVRKHAESVSIDTEEQTIELNTFDVDSAQLSASVSPADAEQMIVWSSSDETIATVDENGLVKAKSNGSAVITAMAADGSGKKATVNVVVTGPQVAITPERRSLFTGETIDFESTVTGADGIEYTLEWYSSNPSCVQINKTSGAAAAKGIGDAEIYAVIKNGDKSVTSNIASVTVAAAPGLELSGSSEVYAGDTFSLTAEKTNVDGRETSNLTWYSSDMSVAEVNPQTGVITAISEGEVTIGARYIFEGRTESPVKAEKTIKVKTHVGNLSVSPSDIMLVAGASDVVTAEYSLDSIAAADDRFKPVWSVAEGYEDYISVEPSDDGKTATITATQYDLSHDTAVVTVSVGEKTADVNVKIIEKPLTKYTVTVIFAIKGGDIIKTQQDQLPAYSKCDYSVSCPVVLGYAPVGNISSYRVNIDSLEGDKTFRIEYEPAEVGFNVEYYFQNLDGKGYTYGEELADDSKKDMPISVAKTGVKVGEYEDSFRKEFPGFWSKAYDDTITVAADGSTVVKLYYDRNMSLIDFDLVGGYGVEPIYELYGTAVTIPAPTKPGYTFLYYTLNGEQVGPTHDPKTPYSYTTSVPAEDIVLEAEWKANEVNYTVVYWYENADSTDKNDIDNYSYAGKGSGTAEAGTPVSSSKHQANNFTGNDSKHFTYYSGLDENNVIVNGDGSTVLNVYFTRNEYTVTFKNDNDVCQVIKAKYQADIGDKWPIAGQTYQKPDGTNYAQVPTNLISWEKVNNSSQVTKIYTMTADLCVDSGKTLTADTSNNVSDYQINYWIESLYGSNVEVPTKTYDNRIFVNDERYSQSLKYTSTNSWGGKKIDGFTYLDKSEKTGNTFNLYYKRNRNTITFLDNYGTTTATITDVMFEMPLSKVTYNNSSISSIVPAYPESLEPGVYDFAGWYTTSDCLPGTEAKLVDSDEVESDTMPNGPITFYAKWEPKTHTVRIKNASGESLLEEDITLNHGDSIPKELFPDAPQLKDQRFLYWYYVDENEVEHPFGKESPVVGDITLMPKYTRDSLIKVRIHYRLDETDVADETLGDIMSGGSKTFDAKAGEDLYPAFAEGIFPKIRSHNVVSTGADDETLVEYTFEYEEVEAVPYTVYHIFYDSEGNEVYRSVDDNHQDNRMSTVTEDCITPEGDYANFLPDKAQQTLVVATEEENIIVFEYREDKLNVPLIVKYYLQNVSDDNYTQDSTVINQKVPKNSGETGVPVKSFDGFTIDHATANNEDLSVSGDIKVNIGENGVEVHIYFNRNLYGYKVQHVVYQSDPLNVLETETPSGEFRFGSEVTASAKEFEGYELTDGQSETKDLTIGKDENKNVITFYYSPKQVSIFYKIIGSDNCGQLSSARESDGYADNMTINGSEATASVGYEFIGWFEDEDCQIPVSQAWLDGNKLTPQQDVALHYSATYYAKFAPLSFGYTVEYYYDGKLDESKTESDTAEYGSQIDSYEDKNITGYKLDKVENKPLTITEVAANNVMKVYYTPRTDLSYTVKYLDQGTNAQLHDPTTVEAQTYGATVKVSDVRADNKEITDTFVGYHYVKSSPEESITVGVDETKNVIILFFAKNTHDLVYKIDGQYFTNEKYFTETSVEYGTEKIVKANAEDKTGYTFSGWSTEDVTVTGNKFLMPDNNVTFVGHYEPNIYNVTYKVIGVDGTETVVGEVENHAYGSEVELRPAYTVDTGYTVTGWTVRTAGVTVDENGKFTMPASNVEIVATISRGTYQYTIHFVDIASRGSDNEIKIREDVISQASFGDSFSASDLAAVKEYAIENYEFVEGDPNPLTITADNDQNQITLYYKKSVASYTVNYYWLGDLENTLVDSVTRTGNIGDTFTAEQKSIEGYTFARFSVDGGSKNISSDTEANVINVYYYKDVKLTANSDTRTYNGKSQSADGYSASVSDLKFEGITAHGEGINITTATNPAYDVTFSAPEGKTAKGSVDTTGKYIVSAVEPGSLTINPIKITVKANSGKKYYDGDPIKASDLGYNKDEVEVKLAEGHVISVSLSGERTLVGETDAVVGDVVIKDNAGNDVTGNYIVKKENGKLIVLDNNGDEDDPTYPGTDDVDPEVVTKEHTEGVYKLGDTVEFTITVTNIYDEEKIVTVTELNSKAKFENGTTVYVTEEPVQPGDSFEVKAYYEITEDDILSKDSLVNNVKVEFSGNDKPYESEDEVKTDDPKYALEVTKESDVEGKAALGQ